MCTGLRGSGAVPVRGLGRYLLFIVSTDLLDAPAFILQMLDDGDDEECENRTVVRDRLVAYL